MRSHPGTQLCRETTRNDVGALLVAVRCEGTSVLHTGGMLLARSVCDLTEVSEGLADVIFGRGLRSTSRRPAAFVLHGWLRGMRHR